MLPPLGAKNVLVGEGPGHQRDTELVLLDSGFKEALRQLKVPFVDLNRDELVTTRSASSTVPRQPKSVIPV